MMAPPKPKPKPIAIPIHEVFEQAIPIPINRVESPMSVITIPEPDPTICPSMGMILDTVATQFKVGTLDIKSARRSNNIVMPRQIFMYLARYMTCKTLPQIGLHIGGRDHTTILHGVRKIEKLRVANAQLDETIRELEIKISRMANEAASVAA